jgi:UDP-N-acetylmuramyl pentapeptide phosphotransferase/UDP-N-acetylglucosamine-1-phosphate transferase
VPGRWALAFTIAAILAMAGAAMLRAASRRGTERARRCGGLVLVAAVIVGSFLVPNVPGWVVVAGIGAVTLALFGAADAAHAFPGWVRLVVVTGAAGAVVATGARVEATGITAVDIVGTIVLIVAVANGTRWLDQTDGLAAGTLTVAAAGVFAIAGFGDQNVVAVVAAAIGGGCVGFLAYNMRPASVFLNEGGALFLGYLTAILAIEVNPVISAPGNALVPLLLLAVPLVEIIVAPLGEMRHRRRVHPGRRDHLAHRLSALGLHRTLAIALLVGVQLALAVIAVFVGRGVVDSAVGAALGGGIVLALAIVTGTRNMYGERAPGFSRRFKLAAIGVLALIAVAAIPSALAALQARRSVDNARALVQRALTAARAGDARTARARFAAAAGEFDDARGMLDNPLMSMGLAIPVVGPNVRAARDVARVGADLARSGEQTAGTVDPDRLHVVDGTVPLAEVQRVTPELQRGARDLQRAVRSLDRIDHTFLLPPVRDGLRKVDHELVRASDEADNAVASARLAPAIFGGQGTRRYFLAVQNTAEQRATGGFIGNWGILTAADGKVQLDHFERISVLNPRAGTDRPLTAPEDYLRRYQRFEPSRTWQNINMSPDFPTVAQVMADQYRLASGEQVDGFLAVDPDGLAALLRLTGPVRVSGWPEPLTAENVVRVTLSDAYVRFGLADPQRTEFLGDVAEAAVDRATHVQLGNPAKVARTLGRAARQGHLIVAMTRPEEEALAQQLDIAGKMPAVHSDSLLITTQNGGGNKVDYYLKRHLKYTLHVDPGSGDRDAQLQGRLEVTLDNNAPNAGLPTEVIGPHDDRFTPGENRSFVSIYTPLGFTAATIDGQPASLDTTTELQRNVFSTFVSVPAQSSGTLALDVTGTLRLERGGWYRLDLVRQPGLTPDDVTVNISVPPGWRITEKRGVQHVAGRTATAKVQLSHTTSMRIRLTRGGGNLWEQLVDGS